MVILELLFFFFLRKGKGGKEEGRCRSTQPLLYPDGPLLPELRGTSPLRGGLTPLCLRTAAQTLQGDVGEQPWMAPLTAVRVSSNKVLSWDKSQVTCCLRGGTAFSQGAPGELLEKQPILN